MNVLHKYTRKSLRANRTRTLVTIIGIVLSMALFTAVIEGGYSGIQYVIRSVTEAEGAYHAVYHDVAPEDVSQLREAEDVALSSSLRRVGWARIETKNEYMPYLLIEAMDDDFTDLAAVHLVSGRMPENESELLLPSNYLDYVSSPAQLGDVLTLDVGVRMSRGYEMSDLNAYDPDGDETLERTQSRTYTVVGFYKRLTTDIDGYASPGFVSLTVGEADGPATVLLTVNNPSRFYDVWPTLPDVGDSECHSDLLHCYGSFGDGTLTGVMNGFMTILILLIVFGSISLIYNSFSISVNERTRQFGILKSVGATNKQIRSSVLYEALVLDAVAIPLGMIIGCIGIGVTLFLLRDNFSSFLFGGDSPVQMQLVIAPMPLILSAAICLVTTLISAWIPARKAMRLTAIDAVRQSRDVKISGRDVKTSSLTQKLFGFEGTMASKNFKRNRRRYRSTVVSLFLSVTLFIAASSFCAYLTDLVDDVNAGDAKVDLYYSAVGKDQPDADELLRLLSETDGVTDGLYLHLNSLNTLFPVDVLTEQALDDTVYLPAGSDTASTYLDVAFIDSAAFARLCREDGVSEDALAGGGILINRFVQREFTENGRYWREGKLLKEERVPLTLTARINREIDGYYFGGYDESEENAMYFPEDYHGEDDGEILAVPVDESVVPLELPIAAVIDSTELIGTEGPMLLYSAEAMESMLSGLPYEAVTGFTMNTQYGFRSSNHANTFEQMKAVLEENGLDAGRLRDYAADKSTRRMLVTTINVFAYGFIILISLIAAANVFNTISTNISLRRRELAMLKSVGMGRRGFNRMMNYECLIYGIKGLVWGLPAAVLVTYAIYRVTGGVQERSFYIPWYSILIAVGSVFAVVFATMLYSMRRIKREDPMENLKQENL